MHPFLYHIGMKTVRVVAAVIKEGSKIFATQRGYGDYKGGWEFPGGKIESGETAKEALVREISEELDVRISVGDLIQTVEYDYPSFHLSMDCFWAEIEDGSIKLLEHSDGKWLCKNDLNLFDWLPADLCLIETLRNSMS